MALDHHFPVISCLVRSEDLLGIDFSSVSIVHVVRKVDLVRNLNFWRRRIC